MSDTKAIRQTFWVDARGRISLARFGLRDCTVLIEQHGEGVVIRRVELPEPLDPPVPIR